MEFAITLLFRILSWIVIIDVVLSYFMDPYHPLRRALDRIVEPMLAPIRRILPSTGMLDFSPLVLLILLQLLSTIVINAFR
ncbi:MAG: YggT family protein [Anaerolineales bacterium]|jgi:YggT family protein|nr:YggT family protein [Anaerolineales bacterium]MBX3004758.1 YggT family protein [Anaerolineales bacterium]MCW5838376.1 YggT family protein [Anaerolineales bacterium]MCW5887112.1 YggT family protein [Anaerolineales bacterium]